MLKRKRNDVLPHFLFISSSRADGSSLISAFIFLLPCQSLQSVVMGMPKVIKEVNFFFQLCFLLHSFVFFWGFHYDMQKFWFMCFVYLLTGYYYSVCPCEIGRLQGCSSSQILVKFYICHFYAQGCILLQLKRLC